MIRTASQSDLQRLEQLWFYSVTSAHPSLSRHFWEARAAEFRRHCREADCLVYADTIDGIAEGFAAIRDLDSLEYLCVSPAFAGRGAGSELMRATKRGRPQLQARVLQENLGARYFLQQHGFVEIERQPSAEACQAEILMCYFASGIAAAG